MLRRPLTAAAVSYAAGTAAQHLAEDCTSHTALAGSIAALLFLLYFFIFNCNKILKNNINGKYLHEYGKQDSMRRAHEHDLEKNCCKECAAGQLSQEDNEFLRKKMALIRKSAVIATVFFIFGAVSGYISENRVSQFNDIFGEQIVLKGIITSTEPKAEEKCAAVVKTFSKGGSRSEKVLVNIKGINRMTAADLTGHTVSIEGIVKQADCASNPGTFDYRLYLRSRGIYSTMSVEAEQLKISKDASGVINTALNKIAVIKTGFEESVSEKMDEEAAQMMFGILFGDDSFMEEGLKESFRQNGLAHLLAASGLHVGFVYGLLSVLMRKPKTLRGNVPVALALIIYAAFAGFSSSVVRAVFMIIVHIVGNICHRRYDFLTCISFCMLTLLIYEPCSLFSSGFQLSFAAVFTLSVVLKFAEKLTSGIYKAAGDDRGILLRPAVDTLASMVALQLGMMPLTLKNFHYISFAGLLLNVPAIALAGLIVPVGIIMMPFCFAGGAGALAFEFILNMEEMLVRALLWINGLAEGSSLAFKYVASPPTAVFVMYYVILFFLCSETGQEWVKEISKSVRLIGKRAAAAPLIAAAVVSAGCGIAADHEYMAADMVFVDVGQGDCAHLKADGGKNIIFDSGGSEKKDVGKDTLMPYFLGNGVGSIDLAVISHLHTDHYAGLLTLKDAVKVKKLMLSAAYASNVNEISQEAGVPPDDILFVKAGDTVSIGGAQLRVLAPAKATDAEYKEMLENSDDENALCLIVKAEYKGRSVLFTGDIDSEYEKELVEIYGAGLQSDILKAAHHGSKYSSCSEFLEAVSPKICVIQVGTNLYGHPTPEAIERIETAGSALFRNDTDGAVLVYSEKDLTVRRFKK